MTDRRCPRCINNNAHPFACQQAVDIMDAEGVAIQQRFADTPPTYIDWCDQCEQATIYDQHWVCTSCNKK